MKWSFSQTKKVKISFLPHSKYALFQFPVIPPYSPPGRKYQDVLLFKESKSFKEKKNHLLNQWNEFAFIEETILRRMQNISQILWNQAA